MPENGPTTVVVGILNLQVILSEEGPNSWIAQAIEIDYAAGGTSQEDVKKRFEQGLCETLQANFQLLGNGEKFLHSKAPAADWLDLLRQPSLKFSQVSAYSFIPPPNAEAFPFGKITYYGATHQPSLVEA